MKKVVPSIGHLVGLSDAHCHVQLVAPRFGEPTWSDGDRGIAESGPNINLSESGDKSGKITQLRLHHAVLCGTHPQIDWATLKQLAGSSSELRLSSALQCASYSGEYRLFEDGTTINDREVTDIIVGFGVHPWYVPEVEGENENCTGKDQNASARSTEKMLYATDPVSQVAVKRKHSHLSYPLSLILEELEELLRVFPKAIVGEIGLDKMHGPCETTQVKAFLEQIKLAAKYRRPVSVHCVRYYGLLLQLLQKLPAEHTPPSIILHGFTGSFSIAESLLKLKPKKFKKESNKTIRIADHLFFSVGSKTTGSLKDFVERTLPLLCKPKKRILLESDLHYELCVQAPLLSATREGDALRCETQTSLLPRFLDVPNASNILASLEQMLDTIYTSLVSTELKDCQGSAKDPEANKEVVSFLEDVFGDAFAEIL
ncbi:unnamed protein product [Phytomonas sp. EM1]|nr:unnamed protein product [Phytomonas sp. EM1]|eukprot:CCW61194.1 unnamed protein product [Phytomonas sp. isolate EM1]